MLQTLFVQIISDNKLKHLRILTVQEVNCKRNKLLSLQQLQKYKV